MKLLLTFSALLSKMKVWAGKCEQCNEWYAVDFFPLLWQISEGAFRGICIYCQESLEKKASELDWSEDECSK